MTAICVDVLFQQKSIKNLVDISSRVSDTTDCEDSAARPDGIPIPGISHFPIISLLLLSAMNLKQTSTVKL